MKMTARTFIAIIVSYSEDVTSSIRVPADPSPALLTRMSSSWTLKAARVDSMTVFGEERDAASAFIAWAEEPRDSTSRTSSLACASDDSDT